MKWERRGGGKVWKCVGREGRLSFSSDLVSGVNARGSVEQTRETREAFSRLQSRARSRVSRAFRSTDWEKKRETAHSLGWSCRLLNFHWCLSLPNAFQVRVFVSLSHEDQSSVVHSPSAVWAESVSTAAFQLCSRATGSTNDTGIINWVAFQDKPMLTHGSVTFSGIWTTETKCEKVAFSQVR